MNAIERALSRRGCSYYCLIEKLPALLGTTRWKIRLAVESGMIRRVNATTVSRSELAKWISGQPGIRERLLNAGTPESPLAILPAALNTEICITVNNERC